MNNEIKEELLKLNIKIDHIMKIVCELFIMNKSNERFDDKLDQCIKSLNNLNSRVNNILVTNKPIPSLSPPPILTIPSIPTIPSIISSSSSTIKFIPSRNELMEELKKKLAARESSRKIE